MDLAAAGGRVRSAGGQERCFNQYVGAGKASRASASSSASTCSSGKSYDKASPFISGGTLTQGTDVAIEQKTVRMKV